MTEASDSKFPTLKIVHVGGNKRPGTTLGVLQGVWAFAVYGFLTWIFIAPMLIRFNKTCTITHRSEPYVTSANCRLQVPTTCAAGCGDLLQCDELIEKQQSTGLDLRGTIDCCTTTVNELCDDEVDAVGSITCEKSDWDMDIQLYYPGVTIYKKKFSFSAHECNHPEKCIRRWYGADHVQCNGERFIEENGAWYAFECTMLLVGLYGGYLLFLFLLGFGLFGRKGQAQTQV